MTDSVEKRINYGPVAFLGLAMALGPLTALSLGSRYADEETWARANAGLENAQPVSRLAAYGVSGDSAALPDYASGKTIVDVLAGSGVFDTFEEAIKAAGLDQKLSADEPFTLFVPSDEAFAKMSAEQRAALLADEATLAKHVVPGRYTVTDLMEMQSARTLDGASIEVGPSANLNGHLGVGGAELVQTNLFAANGIVHVIDRVIQ